MATNLIDLTGGQRGSVISARDPNLSARRRELERLLAESLKVPAIQSEGELLARLGTVGARRFALTQEREAKETRREAALKTLAEAISPATETIPGAAIGSDIGSQQIVPDQTRERPKTIQELVDVLVGNPDTAEFGFKLGIQDTLARQKRAFADPKIEADISGRKRFVTGERAGQPVFPGVERRSKPGTDVPFPGDVEAQKARLARAGRGELTRAQQAKNAEIDAARRELAASGLSREEIINRSQKATETGFSNKNFDPFINRLVRTATRRKTGDDPEFEQVHRSIFGTTPSAADEEINQLLQEGAGGAEPGAAGTPAASPSRAPPLDPQKRGGSLVRGARRPPATLPQVGKTVTIQGKPYEVLNHNPDGSVMLLDLATGRQFFAR